MTAAGREHQPVGRLPHKIMMILEAGRPIKEDGAAALSAQFGDDRGGVRDRLGVA